MSVRAMFDSCGAPLWMAPQAWMCTQVRVSVCASASGTEREFACVRVRERQRHKSELHASVTQAE
eukprot:1151888-Rhodomonas_salina.1